MKAAVTQDPIRGTITAEEDTIQPGKVRVQRTTIDGEPAALIHVSVTSHLMGERNPVRKIDVSEREALIVRDALHAVLDESAQMRGEGPLLHVLPGKVSLPTHAALRNMPRGSLVQGRDGFFHVALGDGLWSLATEQESKGHPTESVELPAEVLYVHEAKR